MPNLRRILAITLLMLASLTHAENIRLAPPQAMFRDSVSLEQFVQGTLRFVLLHETGHAFVDLYNIPVLGREEDAADRFATWWMSPDEHQDGSDAIAAVEWWLASGRVNGASRDELAWWDEHGIDEQRGYQIICLLYGTDPETMGPLAGRHGLPAERRESCIPEAAQNAASWKTYLNGNTAQLIHQLDGFIVPVNHVAPEHADYNDAAQLVRDWRLLEEIADLLKQFRFPEGKVMIRTYAQECGMPNAYWSPQDQAIVLCYELVAHIANVGQAAGFR
jgi:Putative metallopeptidase